MGRMFVARFPVPGKSPAVVTMPHDLSNADKDMLVGMFSMLAARFNEHAKEQALHRFLREKFMPGTVLLTYSKPPATPQQP
jgi:hypothetical protein